MDVIQRCRRIAEFSDQPGVITRTFLSPAMRACLDYFLEWAHAIGLQQVRVDAAGNFRAMRPAAGTRRLVIGSHLDSVPNAGAFDGILGVVLGMQVAESLKAESLACSLEIVGFSEEEGVRFRRPFIGSTALVNGLDEEFMNLRDAGGVSLRSAFEAFGLSPDGCALPLMQPADGYLEIHIEQGPQLESLGLPLGIVEAIAGQSRGTLEFSGQASHAGTTPMGLRRDALCGAAEWTLAVESGARQVDGLIATVGMLKVEPGAGNVVPGRVTLSLDVRHAQDKLREEALRMMLSQAENIADKRGLTYAWRAAVQQCATPLDVAMTTRLEQCVKQPHRMLSGAGHDAMIVAPHLPTALLFVRSPGGVSHHPDENVLPQDVELAFQAVRRFVENFH